MKKRLLKSIRAKGTLAAIGILWFSCFVTFLIISLIFWLTEHFGWVDEYSHGSMKIFAHLALLLCVVIGSVLLFLALNRITKPIIYMSECAKAVASGDFTVRIETKSQDEIGTLAQNFNSMVEGLSKMEYLRKDFMSSVSHEFKTPIAAIEGFAELLCDDQLPSCDRLEYSGILKEETTRLSRLCSNMLRLSGLDSGTVVLKPRLFSLDEQLRKTVVLLADLWQDKEITIKADLEKVNFFGDDELLQQVWLNLLENAIKFSEVKGKVMISCKKVNERILVGVNNKGKMIEAQDKERIFEKFYQGDKSHGESGNGLGLSIVKRIVTLSQGDIDFESDEENGTTFVVTLKVQKDI